MCIAENDFDDLLLDIMFVNQALDILAESVKDSNVGFLGEKKDGLALMIEKLSSSLGDAYARAEKAFQRYPS